MIPSLLVPRALGGGRRSAPPGLRETEEPALNLPDRRRRDGVALLFFGGNLTPPGGVVDFAKGFVDAAKILCISAASCSCNFLSSSAFFCDSCLFWRD